MWRCESSIRRVRPWTLQVYLARKVPPSNLSRGAISCGRGTPVEPNWARSAAARLSSTPPPSHAPGCLSSALSLALSLPLFLSLPLSIFLSLTHTHPRSLSSLSLVRARARTLSRFLPLPPQFGEGDGPHCRGTSLKRNSPPPGPYCTVTRCLVGLSGGPRGVGVF